MINEACYNDAQLTVTVNKLILILNHITCNIDVFVVYIIFIYFYVG